MRIVFFGSPQSALPSLNKILNCGHDIKLIITQPDRPSGRGKKLTLSPVKKFAIEQNIPVYQPERIRKDPIILEKLKKNKPDLNIVVAYGQIIPASIIYYPKFNSINIHFSLLPKYRGASPVQWALLNGEEKTGVTIFELNEKMDQGNILSQKEISIFPTEGTSELESRLAQEGAELLEETLSQITDIKPIKQDHSQATYAPLIKKEDGRINWEQNALTLERQVRALSPWPSVFAFFRNKRIKILKGTTEIIKQTPLIPGEILEITQKGIKVGCGEGSAFLLEILQPENKKQMSAYSFSLGTQIKPGDKFN